MLRRCRQARRIFFSKDAELLGPKLAHGVMVTQVVPNPGLPGSTLQKEHLDAIRKFRDEPPSHLTVEGFMAAKVLVEAVRRDGGLLQ